jgi:hypothetical protein
MKKPESMIAYHKVPRENIPYYSRMYQRCVLAPNMHFFINYKSFYYVTKKIY